MLTITSYATMIIEKPKKICLTIITKYYMVLISFVLTITISSSFHTFLQLTDFYTFLVLYSWGIKNQLTQFSIFKLPILSSLPPIHVFFWLQESVRTLSNSPKISLLFGFWGPLHSYLKRTNRRVDARVHFRNFSLSYLCCWCPICPISRWPWKLSVVISVLEASKLPGSEYNFLFRKSSEFSVFFCPNRKF